MKVLLVCASGMSTSILMKKMTKYAETNGIELEIAAKGLSEYADYADKYDVLLLGPQVSYQKAKIAAAVKIPVDVIAPSDYGIGNAANIFKQINKLLGK